MQNIKKENLSSSLEDYLEAIFNLSGKTDAVHSTEIAKVLSVAKPSVTGALRTLKKKGLVNYKPYGCVTLTDSGRKAAMRVAHKHNIIKSFFTDILGIDADIAQQAACKAEHAFGPEVAGRLLMFVDFVTKNEQDGQNITEQFKSFCRNTRKNSFLERDAD